MSVYQLDERIIFPNPELGEEDGLLAVGGDLSIERLVLSYSYGIFPWFNEGEPILWWCPMERFIIKPHKVKISKSMRRVFNKGEFNVTFNNDFEGVIEKCRSVWKSRGGTWITNEMKEAYINLFKNGFGFSVEVYKEDELVGGMYGVKLQKCYFGESMFSTETNASKVALISICNKIREEGGKFLDCQMHTNHLESLGGEFISWKQFKYMIDCEIKR